MMVLKKSLFVVALLFLILLVPSAFAYECVYDYHCLGDLVCDAEGFCVDPVIDTILDELDDLVTDTNDTNVSSPDFDTVTVPPPPVQQQSTLEVSQIDPALEADVEALKSSDVIQNSQLASLESETIALNQRVSQLSSEVQLVKSQVVQGDQALEEELESTLAGLAALEEDVTQTREGLGIVSQQLEQGAERSSFFRTLSLILIVFVVMVALLYFMLSHGKLRKEVHVPQEVRDYITTHIKKGEDYEQIKKKLLASGWPEAEIKRAYDLTSKKNYFDYLKAQGKVSADKDFAPIVPPNNQKIILFSVLSIFIVGALILFMGNSTGQAIYTGQDFSGDVLLTLETYLDQNVFYPLIENAEFCVQVNDEVQSPVSYRILKGPSGHAITATTLPCDWNSWEYDFAVKFKDWQSFSALAQDLECTHIRFQHTVYPAGIGERGVTVLPSRFVGAGFQTTAFDYTPYCAALRTCLTDVELFAAGINC